MSREPFEFEKSEAYQDMGNAFLEFAGEYYLFVLLGLIFIIALLLIWIVYLLYKRNYPLKDIQKELEEDIKRLNKEKRETIETNQKELNNYYLKETKNVYEVVMDYASVTETNFINAAKRMETLLEEANNLYETIDDLKKANEEYIESSLVQHEEVVKDRDNKGRQIFKLKQKITKNKNNNG